MGIVATIITATQPKINYMSSSPTATMNNKSLSNSSVLSSGVYVAGQDFKGGKYNIIAVSGSGNISSSNMYTGGVDGEISSDNNGAYKEYRNIKKKTQNKYSVFFYLYFYMIYEFKTPKIKHVYIDIFYFDIYNIFILIKF